MSRYARGTAVNQSRSRDEIERMLVRYGADEFGYLSKKGEAMIGFTYRKIRVRMCVPLPGRFDGEFTHTVTGRKRAQRAAMEEWEKETRRRWRSLCLLVKALLVGVEDGVISFEEAFMPHIVWGDGMTTAEKLLPTIAKAVEGGKMPSVKQLTVMAE